MHGRSLIPLCSAKTFSTTNDAVFEMATDNVKHYFTRVFPTPFFQPDWTPDLHKNTLALVLGFIAVISITVLADKLIESILLNHFDAFSRDWCFTETDEQKPRLARVQDVLQRGLLSVVVLMRWPGWRWYRLHLWECVWYGVVGFAVLEGFLVTVLCVAHGFMWTAHHLVIVTGWQPHSAAPSKVRFVHDGFGTPPERPKRFTAPGSVDMGKFLTRVRGDDGAAHLSKAAMERQKFWTEVSKQGLFFANEKENGAVQTTVYHTVTAKEENWDFSLEELRLQHYKDTGKFATLLATPPTAGSTAMTESRFEAEQQQKKEARKSGGNLLPSWLSGRSFRDSIFGSSVGTEAIQDTFGKRRDSAVDDEIAQMVTPDLLTGSPFTRKFT